MVGYAMRYGLPVSQTVTHPSSNRARCRATTLMDTNHVLTTTPLRHAAR